MTHTMEFSRVFTLSRLINNSSETVVEASPQENLNLAQRFELLTLSNFHAHFWLQAGDEPGAYHLKGHLDADVVQACIFTLEDVVSHVQADFNVILLPMTHKIFQDEQDMDPDHDYEAIHNDEVDLAEIAAQYLSISLNPYPCKEGAMPLQPIIDSQAAELSNPFNVLADLRR